MEKKGGFFRGEEGERVWRIGVEGGGSAENGREQGGERGRRGRSAENGRLRGIRGRGRGG